jgi:ABC-type uncharacterized transport system substrate-binding protein
MLSWHNREDGMVSNWVTSVIVLLLFLAMIPRPVDAGGPPPYKVLVVMSYHETYSWGKEIKEGIDSVLSGVSEVKYVYLDTKNNISGGAEKAAKIHELYRKLRPDGVIAADDAAQSLFVVPYLKDKVQTPVMVCGVNDDPSVYGYPAANVSGILERGHFAESLSLLRQMVPSVKTFCSVMKDDDTSRGDFRQMMQGARGYSARFVTARFPKTFPEAVAMTEEIRGRCDALYLSVMEGLPAADGTPLSSRDVIPVLVRAFGKPTFSGTSNNLQFGVLCSVIKTGQEQGSTAARMLLKVMRGKPVSGSPMVVNREGKRVVNVSVMKRMGIRPRPIVLRGVEMITSEE